MGDAATLVGVLIATVGSFAFGGLMRYRSTKRRIRRVRHVALGDAPEGETVRIAGVVRELEPLVTTPSQRACVAYELRIETFDSTAWTSLHTIRRAVGFAVEDGTTRCIVDPTDAELAIEPDRTSHEVREADLSADERRLLVELGFAGPDGEGDPVIRRRIRDELIRFRELVLAVGDRVAIVGAGIGEGAAGEDYREGATQLRFSASKRSPLLITDDPKLAGPSDAASTDRRP